MKKLLTSFLILSASLALGALTARAATYNFYFNNTEQGENGVANPSVNVLGDGKVVKTPAQEKAEPPKILAHDPELDGPVAQPASAQPAPSTPAAVAQDPVSTAQAASAFATEESEKSYWRLTLGLAAMENYGASDGSEGLGAMLSFGHFFTQDIGLSLFGGVTPATNGGDQTPIMAGLELELLPIHITLGRLSHIVDLGLVAGVEALDLGGDVQGVPEAGIRANVNLGRNWALTSVLRATQNYATLEAGLALKL